MQYTLTRAPGGWPSDLPSPPPHPHPSLLNKVAAHLAGVPTTMFCHPDALAAGLALSARAAPPGPLRARLAAEHARRTAVAGEIRAAAERRRERNLLKRSSMAEVKSPGAWSLVAAQGEPRCCQGWTSCQGGVQRLPRAICSPFLSPTLDSLLWPSRRSFLPWEWEREARHMAGQHFEEGRTY